MRKISLLLCFLFLIVGIAVAQTERFNPIVYPGFEYKIIDENPDNPAWINIQDLDSDQIPELIVSVFANSGPLGSGYVAIYKMKGEGWTKTILPGSKGISFPNDTTIVDVDGDSDLDIILPSGFLATMPFYSGAIAWFENMGNDQWKKHEICSGKKLFYHLVLFVDIDNDGIKDFVTVGESKNLGPGGYAETQFFKGLGNGQFATNPTLILASSLGSLPSLVDLDKDGDLDIISAQYFQEDGAAAWLENMGQNNWKKHIIATDMGPSIQLSLIANLCGDGKTVAVLANHANSLDNPNGPKEGVFLLTIPEDYVGLISPWKYRLISTGIRSRKSPLGAPQAAPGIFRWSDIDKDGDIDIIVLGDGDPTIYFLEQISPGQFETRKLITEMPQGGIAIGDLDRDGVDEIVLASYENNKLLILKRK